MKIETLLRTDYNLPGQQSVYHGKVRDVYFLEGDLVAMIATDRISAFDVVLPAGIPYKGQVLNQIATPDPMVTIGHKCEPFKVEMVIRGYITGSAWRAYQEGARSICGIPLAEGLRENQRFEHPIITPTTKADEGHDENISREEIISSGLVSEEDYTLLEQYTQDLFARGSKIAEEMGLILVDTKYEFGKKDGKIYLIDEIHTPDSSRYFYPEGFEERFAKGEPQRQLSKEFVRKWLTEQGFMGKEGQKVPEMTDEYCLSVAERYIELYEHVTGEKFVRTEQDHLAQRIEKNITDFLKKK